MEIKFETIRSYDGDVNSELEKYALERDTEARKLALNSLLKIFYGIASIGLIICILAFLPSAFVPMMICTTIYLCFPFLVKLQENHQKAIQEKRDHELKMLKQSIE